MKTLETVARISKRIAEDPTARHELAAALESGDPDEIDRVVTALGGGERGAPTSHTENKPDGPMYFT